MQVIIFVISIIYIIYKTIKIIITTAITSRKKMKQARLRLQEERNAYIKIEELYDNKEIDKAIELYENYHITNFVTKHELNYKIGTAYLEKENYWKALGCFNLAIKYERNNASYYLSRAFANLKYYAPEAAISDFSEFEKLQKDNDTYYINPDEFINLLYKEAEYYYKKATELFSKPDFENALNNIDLAIRYNSNDKYIELKNKIQRLIFKEHKKYREEYASSSINRINKNAEWWMSLSPWDFEKEIAELFREQGYNAKITRGSGDGGVDLFLTKNSINIIVQCKQYANPVPPEPIRALWGVKDDFGADKVFLIATNGITAGGEKFIQNKPEFIVYTLDDIVEMSND